MKIIINRSDLHRRSDRELAGMAEQLRKEAGSCEQRRRKVYAAVADIRRVQAQRKIMRPNF